MSTIIRTLSTLSSNLTGRNNVTRMKAELDKAGTEVATGYRADVFKDLGMRTSQTIALRSQMDRTDAYVTSNTLLANKMQLIADVVGSVRDVAQEVLDLAVINLNTPGQTAKTLQQQAQTALDAMIGMLNTSYAGESLFSGLDTDKSALRAYGDVNPGTGLSPKDVIDGIVGGTLINNGDAAAKIAALNLVFTSTDVATPAQNFENTFYNGTSLLDAGGNPNARMSATIDDGRRVTYGIQANDPAISEIAKGLMMLVSTDVSMIGDPAAYQTWMASATSAIISGIEGITTAQSRLGGQQASLDLTITQQQDQMRIYTSQIVTNEGVDGYEAASRFSALEAQLEATYTVTARLSQLSFLHFM